MKSSQLIPVHFSWFLLLKSAPSPKFKTPHNSEPEYTNPIFVLISTFSDSMDLLTSKQMNLLVYRHLQDSGFERSAAVFGEEADIDLNDGSWVPNESLSKLVEKRLRSLKMQPIVINVDSDTDEDISDLVTKDAAETSNAKELSRQNSRTHRSSRSKSKRRRSLDHITLRERIGNLRKQKTMLNDDINEAITVGEDHSKNVIRLEGHSVGIRCCAWSPEEGRTLASGSGDSTARIWNIADGKSSSSLGKDPLCLHVLKHDEVVTALDWNLKGTLLATGSRDGKTRVWDRNGELLYTRSLHNAAILSLKWNRVGDCILTGSNDNTAIVWDIDELSEKQFTSHSDSILDVDWKDDYTFVTCSTDHMIYAWRVTKTRPIRRFSGHEAEVNCVKWDSSGKLLASCSEDKTVKIWSMDQEKYVIELRGHAQAIYTLRWSPIEPDTTNLNSSPVLASASYDSTVKLWDVKQGDCIVSLDDHRDAVVAVAFSPDGKYLATGSLDKSLRIWHLEEVKISFTYTASDAICGVCWNKEGDKIAVWFFNSQILVLDPWRAWR